MKKNFFKKLSFVLALAMVMSSVAPAAGAFAATAPKLNSTKKYLHLDVDGQNEYDFNIANKGKGWKYSWESSDEDVVVVDKSGVATAAGVGSAKVTVFITDKNGEDVTDLSATVTVRDNIKSLAISNKPAGDKLAIGKENDFGRTYVTNANKTSGSASVTRWSVDPADGATIDDKGLFVATKAGTYKVTARAFQSKEKFESWKVDSTKYAGYVLASADYTLTVPVSMVSAKQTDLDTFTVTFDSAVADAKTKLSVANLVGSTEVATLIKSVSMSADNKVATVDLYANFTEGTTYVVSYPNLTSVQFVAGKTEANLVKSVQVTTTQAEIGKETEVKVALLNADGVNIADAELLNRVTFETSSNLTYLAGNKLYMYTVGQTSTITATYHTYNYDTATGTETGNLTGTGVITCVDKIADVVKNIAAYDVATSYDAFKTVNHSLSVDDAAYKLFVKLTLDEADKSYDTYVNNNDFTTLGKDGWQLTSSNTGVLIVDNAGNLYAVAPGTANVVVSYKDKVVGAVAITVGARREVSTVTLDNYSFTLSNDDSVSDFKDVKVNVKDQFGATLDAGKYSVDIERTSAPSIPADRAALLQATQDTKTSDWKSQSYRFTGVNTLRVAEGTYVYKITVQDSTSYKKMYAYATVNVAAPSSLTDSYYYKVETDSTSYDLNINRWDSDNTRDVMISLFGYASNGIRNQRIAVTGSNLTINDNATWYTPVFSTVGTDGKISLVNGAAEIAKAATGTWTLTATSGSAVLATAAFSVADTQDKPSVTVNKLYFDVDADTTDGVNGTSGDANVTAAVKKAFTFTNNGDDVTGSIEALTSENYTGANGVYFIKYVYIHEALKDGSHVATGAYINHKVTVNATITIVD